MSATTDPDHDLIADIREVLRRAILTLLVVPDSEARYLTGRSGFWPDVVHDAEVSYGWGSAWVRRHTPSAYEVSNYLDVLTWFTWWLDHGGPQRDRPKRERCARLFFAWARGFSMGKLGANFRVSKSTIHRWIDGLAQAIGTACGGLNAKGGLDGWSEWNEKQPSTQYGVDIAPGPADPSDKAPLSFIAPGAKPNDLARLLDEIAGRDHERTLAKIARTQARLIRRRERSRAP